DTGHGDRVAGALLVQPGAVEARRGFWPESEDLLEVLFQQLLDVRQDHESLVRPFLEDEPAEGADDDGFTGAGRGYDQRVAAPVLEILEQALDGSLLVIPQLHPYS